MRSLKQLLGDRFFDLLEAAGDQACQSVRLLSEVGRGDPAAPRAISDAHERYREVGAEIATRLRNTIMASLKKEDIEELTNALARIPEAAERIAGRWMLTQEKLGDLRLAPLTDMLVPVAKALAEMVHQLRLFECMAATRKLHGEVTKSAERVEALGAQLVANLYSQQQDAIAVVMAKDVIDQLTSIAELCSECGDLVQEIVLKYD